jgi:hypothetical protein
MEHYGHYREDQKNVDEESRDMKDEKSAEPQQKQQNSKT